MKYMHISIYDWVRKHLYKRGHACSSPSTKHTVTMVTDQSQHIVSITELLRCQTIIMAILN